MNPINLAFLQIAKRAENQDDVVLKNTFVDFGSALATLTTLDHQIVYGRRGTGKTHLLTAIRQDREKVGEISIQLDMRNLGSAGGIYADTTIPLTQRATRLLVDVLASIHGSLLDQAVTIDGLVNLGIVGSALDELFDTHTSVKVVGETFIESSASAETIEGAESKLGLSASVSSVSLSGELKLNDSVRDTVSAKKTVKGIEVHRVNFGSIGTALHKVVDSLPNKRLWILIDEWSEVPLDIQPLLADLIKRAILPIKGISVKIAAIEQRSRFRSQNSAQGRVGLEVGADISSDVNLDDFMVFDNDESRAVDFFKKLVFAHVKSALAAQNKVLETEAKDTAPKTEAKDTAPKTEAKDTAPMTEADFLSKGFSQGSAFDEVVRASEGVPRDAIHILSHAARRAADQTISVGDVRKAAQQWYQASKETAVDAHTYAKNLLLWIVDKVIKERQAKAFLIESNVKDALIDFLYDERVLHILRKGISAKDAPGKRFNVYGIDYGCYVDLINTVNAPKGFLNFGEEENDFVYEVPKTDLRSVRRCVLDLPAFYDYEHVLTS